MAPVHDEVNVLATSGPGLPNIRLAQRRLLWGGIQISHKQFSLAMKKKNRLLTGVVVGDLTSAVIISLLMRIAKPKSAT